MSRSHTEPTAGRRNLTAPDLKAIEEINFLRQHPELTNYVGMLINTALICDDSKLTLEGLTLGEAYDHVFRNCDWCKRAFRVKKGLQEKLFMQG